MDGDHPTSAAPDASAHQDQTRRLVRAMMALTGLSASGLARAAGLTPSTINRFMHRAVRHTLSQRTMLTLMTETFLRLKDRPRQMLQTSALAELAPAIAIYEQGMLDAAPGIKALLAEAKALLGTPAAQPLAELARAPTLPVLLAATQGVNVAAAEFAQAPLKTQRPPFLDDDPRAFALLMPNAAMAPRFDAGDMLYVSPARTLEGDKIDVVVEHARGGFSVGTLIAATDDTVRVATLAPRARESYARGKLRGIYRIVGVQRLGG